MKKPHVYVIAIALLSFGFAANRFGGIIGRVVPTASVSKVLLISGADTLNTEVNQGSFNFKNLKEGTYRLLIKARSPYRDTVFFQVAVKDGATTDMGDVKLKP